MLNLIASHMGRTSHEQIVFLCLPWILYCTHIIFVKATHSICLSDTILLNHKYIMPPTITPADAIVKPKMALCTSSKACTMSKANSTWILLTNSKTLHTDTNLHITHNDYCKALFKVQLPWYSATLDISPTCWHTCGTHHAYRINSWIPSCTSCTPSTPSTSNSHYIIY